MRLDPEEKFSLTIFGVVSVVTLAIGWFILSDYYRLKSECMSDSRKEYECVAMLRVPFRW